MTASPTDTPFTGRPSSRWLRGLRSYLGTIAVGNLLWEGLQLPLYTIWRTGTLREQAFAIVHCTGGDVLIALSALTLALITVGDESWPGDRFRRVAGLALIFGLAYTAFSEWLNVVVRAGWAYSDLMPIVSIAGLKIGLSPLLQWIVVPGAGFAVMRWVTNRADGGRP
jgi:hypothetical protein